MPDLSAVEGDAHGSTRAPGTSDAVVVPPASMARVERALAGAVRHHAGTVLALRAAVEACASELAARAIPPERVLIAMKGLVRHVTIDDGAAPGDTVPRSIADIFMDDVVRWTIGAYYGREIRAPAARRADAPWSARGIEAAAVQAVSYSRIDGR